MDANLTSKPKQRTIFNKTSEERTEIQQKKMPSKTIAVEHKASTNFVESDTSILEVGNQVEHQRFGFGNVLTLEGPIANKIANIDFGPNGVKKIMLNYAKLRIV